MVVLTHGHTFHSGKGPACLGGIFRCTRGVPTVTFDAPAEKIDAPRMSRSTLSMVRSLSSALILAAAAVSSSAHVLRLSALTFLKNQQKVDVTGAVGCIDFLFNFFGGSVLALKF